MAVCFFSFSASGVYSLLDEGMLLVVPAALYSIAKCSFILWYVHR